MLGYLTRGAHTICAQKESVQYYKPYDGDSILMANNTVCKTVGIGNIRMRMLDGHVRALTNVCHVPEITENLLSFGALEAQGRKFSGTDGGIKVNKSSVTILKRERTTTLYKMLGSITIGDASTTTEKENTTRL